MKRRSVYLVLAAWWACSPGEPEVAGVWANKTDQVLAIRTDLSGRLTQQNHCAPQLNVTIHRDPYDAYAIQFVPRQEVYFPLAQRGDFGAAEFFCASPDSTPMCRFCRREGDALACDSTEQKISGHGALVTHDCSWTLVKTATVATSTVPCPAVPDAGMGCGAGDSTGADAGVGD